MHKIINLQLNFCFPIQLIVLLKQHKPIKKTFEMKLKAYENTILKSENYKIKDNL